MNIGSMGKLTSALLQMQSKDLSKLQAEVKKEQKFNDEAVEATKQLGALFKKLEGSLSGLSNGFSDVIKAASAKPTAPPADPKKLAKDAEKMIEAMQAGRVKFLETQIAEVEKKLDALRTALSKAKSAKPSGWFK